MFFIAIVYPVMGQTRYRTPDITPSPTSVAELIYMSYESLWYICIVKLGFTRQTIVFA